MRIAVIGRTRPLLEAAELALARGHGIALVWTCAAEAHYGLGPEAFAALAARAGAVFRADRRIAGPEGVALLEGLGCEVALSVNWPTVLPERVLAAFPRGVLNAHAGDLPRYRGNASPNWAILRGETRIGLSIHQMARGVDAGPVVLRDHRALTADTYIGDLYRWIDARIPPLLVEAAEGLAEGRLVPQPQDEARALRGYPRRPEDARIDWRQPAEQVLRLVRASSRPFAGAFTFLEGERRVTVWRAERLDGQGEFAAVPGQVCFGMAGDPVVAAADALVRLEEIGMEGAATEAEAKRAVLASLRNRLQ